MEGNGLGVSLYTLANTDVEAKVDSDGSLESLERRDGHESSAEEYRKIQRKIDLRIMPWICFTYLVMRIDVNNVANAAILNVESGHGIKQQLHLSPQQWNWVIACFFYPYGALEPLSTLLMKKTTPSFWIGRIMVTWGIVSCLISASQNYAGLITTRVLLGVAEAGYYPCIIYYLAFWFRPEELPLRIAMFYSFGQVSGFVGGFMAFAVSFANGRLPGWRWLFIIEGIPAILCGIVTFWVLPNYPETSAFLSPRERLLVTSRLSAQAPSKSSKTWDTRQVIELILDPTFWTFNFVWIFHAVGGFGLAYVLPTVIFQLGFASSAMSNVLSMPPSLATFILLNLLGWLVRSKDWNPFRIAIWMEVVNIVCCIILITVEVPIVKYLALIVATACAGSVYPILWPKRVEAARGTTAAAIAIGVTNGCAQFSGILGPQVFITTLGPTYRISFIVCIALLGAAIVSIILSAAFMGHSKKHHDHEQSAHSSELELESNDSWMRDVGPDRPDEKKNSDVK